MREGACGVAGGQLLWMSGVTWWFLMVLWCISFKPVRIQHLTALTQRRKVCVNLKHALTPAVALRAHPRA